MISVRLPSGFRSTMGPVEAELLDDESLRSILDLVTSAWRVRLLDARWLPDIAAELIVAGLDSPSLVELAGLDFAPFDPGDASDLLVASLEELGLRTPDRRDALVTLTLLVAWAVEAERLLPRYATQWAFRTYMAGYTDAPPTLTTLFGLNEDYDQTEYGWTHRSYQEIDEDVRTVARRLLAHSEVPRWAVDPVAIRIIELILPSL